MTHFPPDPFRTHLTFFSTTPSPSAASAGRPIISLSSGFRQSLKLGLNFPLAVLATLGLRIAYGNPYTLFLRPVDVRAVRVRRTMLEDVAISIDSSGYSLQSLVQATRAAHKGIFEQLHVVGLWALGANVDGVLTTRELSASREGTLAWEVQERRRFRDGRHGEVLPLLRGGPISVGGHSWFVEKLFGVKVYQSSHDHQRNT